MYDVPQLTYNGLQACAVRLMKHCLPKRFYKDMCLLDFCKMKMSIREATLNLQKPCTSARLRLLAVMCCCCQENFLPANFFVRSNLPIFNRRNTRI